MYYKKFKSARVKRATRMPLSHAPAVCTSITVRACRMYRLYHAECTMSSCHRHDLYRKTMYAFHVRAAASAFIIIYHHCNTATTSAALLFIISMPFTPPVHAAPPPVRRPSRHAPSFVRKNAACLKCTYQSSRHTTTPKRQAFRDKCWAAIHKSARARDASTAAHAHYFSANVDHSAIQLILTTFRHARRQQKVDVSTDAISLFSLIYFARPGVTAIAARARRVGHHSAVVISPRRCSKNAIAEREDTRIINGIFIIDTF